MGTQPKSGSQTMTKQRDNQRQMQGDAVTMDAILTVEFEYIAQSAFQANEDRSRVTSLYLVTLGGFIAALLGSQMSEIKLPEGYGAFGALFVVLALTSVLTLLQIIRLRQAWFESAEAMNQIKRYYILYLPDLRNDHAFRWDPESGLPSRFKPWSAGFLLAIQVALLGGTAAGASVMFLALAKGVVSWPWLLALVVAISWVGIQLIIYWLLLRRQSSVRSCAG